MNEAVEPNPSINVESALSVLRGKWKIKILWHVKDEPRRYGALRRLIPEVTEKVLIRQLRELEADGILLRTDFQTVPPHVEYSLSSYGESLLPVLDILCKWGKLHIDDSKAS